MVSRTPRGGFSDFDWAFVEPEMHAEGRKAVAQTVGNLVIEKWQQAIAAVNESDIDTERLKIEAYSQPMTPPPITARLFGMRSICKNVSESKV